MPDPIDKERLMREYEARFGDNLERDPAVSRIYGSLNQPEPSRSLDSSVLKEARAAARADRREARRRGWRPWLVPASAAAALAVVAVLVLQVLPGQPDPAAPSVAGNETRDDDLGASGDRMNGAAPGPDVPAGIRVDYALMLAEDPTLRPDSQAWFAGIRALRARGELARADAERERFQRASAGNNAEQPLLPDPEVWAMGIDLLASEGDTELAARERQKLSTLFPGFQGEAEED